MIKKTERIKLKRVLKNKWIQKVLDKLSENKVFTEKGKEYDKTYVSHVFNGRNTNENIEKAIFEVYLELKTKHSNFNAKKKNILKNKNLEHSNIKDNNFKSRNIKKKPEADTSDF